MTSPLDGGDLAVEVDRLVALWATRLGSAADGAVELTDPTATSSASRPP
ncbi:MAG: hypothetical protein M3Y35_11580 [Actinomycetota bacterium]|nr:hypothetical protein [Actinomycetota bacterium]